MPYPNPVDRLADLDAVLWSIDNRRELEDLAFASVDETELVKELEHRFQFTEQQCDLVLSSSARRLTRQYRALLRNEREEVRKTIEADT
ncbi:MAG: hypothetical protein U5O16_00120 [Rhodococcus sp. (in: high G+C Gram-positive bacteria)]|uniref:hypothetical protein n=1 Tax=Rhodococcus sp. TaxID=1831 RepID=UPI002AD85A3A|nr:hypothetical protein [Rhodococcus sp. (in: high G+C Gram-positive bacteria)]